MKRIDNQQEEFAINTSAFGLKIFAVRNKNMVIVKLRPVNEKMIEMLEKYPNLIGKARCHNLDTFNFKTGLKLATLRLLEQYWANEQRRVKNQLWWIKSVVDIFLVEIKNQPQKVEDPEPEQCIHGVLKNQTGHLTVYAGAVYACKCCGNVYGSLNSDTEYCVDCEKTIGDVLKEEEGENGKG